LKWIVWSAVAVYRPTGTLTNPKLRKPDHVARAMLFLLADVRKTQFEKFTTTGGWYQRQ
jgi:hypothetical protein